jgi:hypothetical protein
MLEGEGDREIFGSEYIQPIYAVVVMKVVIDNERILLNAGQVHGIRKGARFAVYPLNYTEFNNIEKRLALVEVQQRGATDSWAKIIANYNKGAIEKGAPAVLIDPVDVELKRKVRLVYQSDISIPSNINKTQNKALEQIKADISKEGKGFSELAADDKDKAHFQVAVNKEGQYEIWDPAGMLIPNLSPPLKIDQHNSSSRLIQRLVHLTKYSNIQQIQNHDADSPLSRKLVVELFGISQDYEPGDRLPDLQPIESDGNIKVAKIGQKMILRIRNSMPEESNQVLNVTVLDLQPDWGVQQIYPTSPGAYFIPIDPGKEEYFPLQADLPSSYKEGKDMLKVFATVGQTNFRWLELPILDQPLVQKKGTRGNSPENPLEQLLSFITKEEIPIGTRNLNPSAFPSKEWTSAQLEVKISR